METKGARAMSRRKVATWLLIAALFIIFVVFVSVTSAVVVTLFFAGLALGTSRRIPIAASLALLVIGMLLLVLNQQSGATILGNWAFYFLSIAVALQFVDYVKSSEGKRYKSQREARQAD